MDSDFAICQSKKKIFKTFKNHLINNNLMFKTKPLDRTGTLCLNNESQDSIRLIHLKPVGEGQCFTLFDKN